MYNENLLNEKLLKDSFYKKDKTKLITLQDKLKWLNVNNLTQQKIDCADKILVKKYAKSILNQDICAVTYKIYDSFEDINLDELPNKFILKINNGCAKNIFCFDKQSFNLNKYKENINKWFKLIPGINTREYQYVGITPKLFAEELLINNKNESLIDYRFWCFNNKIQFIAINSDHGWGGQYFVDTKFTRLDIYNKAHLAEEGNLPFNKPENFDIMIEYVEKLSKPFKFVRVDMYNKNSKIYLGEMTFSPGGYCFDFNDKNGNSLNEKYGNLLII